MKITSKQTAAKCKKSYHPVIGLRMNPDELAQCKAFAAADLRSISQFALLMYRRGLAQWQKEQGQA